MCPGDGSRFLPETQLLACSGQRPCHLGVHLPKDSNPAHLPALGREARRVHLKRKRSADATRHLVGNTRGQTWPPDVSPHGAVLLGVKCSCGSQLRSAIDVGVSGHCSYTAYTFPFQDKNRASIRQRIDQSDPHANMFHSVLVIDRVQSQDRGLYTCHVTSGPSSKSVNTSVHIYGKRLTPCPRHRWDVGGSVNKDVPFRPRGTLSPMKTFRSGFLSLCYCDGDV